jgi:curved DNA-binding protein CbpA
MRLTLLLCLACALVLAAPADDGDDGGKSTDQLYEWANDARELGKDYYELLGVKQSASNAEVQRAYLALAKVHHPDVSKDAKSGKLFEAFAKARKILTDSKLRADYDRMLIRGDVISDSDFTVPGLQYYTKFAEAPTHNTYSIFLLVIVLFTAMEYFYMGHKYTETVKTAMLTPSYRAAVRLRREERRIAQGISAKRKNNKASKLNETSGDETLEIELVGIERPTVAGLTIVRLCMVHVWVPWLLGQLKDLFSSSDSKAQQPKNQKIKGAIKISHTTIDHGEMVE